MGETTKVGRDYIRQCLEAGWELVWLIRPGEYGYFDDAPALLADADQLAEWESAARHAIESGTKVTIRRGACAYCGWRSELVPTDKESAALAASHSGKCESNPLVQRITELKAEVHQRDEWLERAKARYEIQAKENARILEDYVATVSDLRGHVERLEAEPRFECWNCGRLNCKTGVCMDCWHSDNPELDAAKAEIERLEDKHHTAELCRQDNLSRLNRALVREADLRKRLLELGDQGDENRSIDPDELRAVVGGGTPSAPIVWEGNFNDDVTARWEGLMLRAEAMHQDDEDRGIDWWWAVYDNEGAIGCEEIVSCYDGPRPGFVSTAAAARAAAELTARAYIATLARLTREGS